MNATAAGILLLCVDVQPIFLNAMEGGSRALRRCAFSIEAASGLGVPVAFTEQVPQKLGGTVPELLALVPRPVVWGKTAFSALGDDGIRDALRARGVNDLLICGLETPVCVYQTAMAAIASGQKVTVLADAVCARRPDDAQTALAALRHAGVQVLPAETVFYARLHDAAHPFFKTYTQLVKKYA
ncbi:MAG TPA: isochorismatase family protein [Opitutaceae bacterium]|nr:isochorismatase family protein [Opitutaceae bacterium]